MKSIDIDLIPPKFSNDPSGTQQMAAYTAKLLEILRYLVDNSQAIKILETAPAVGELSTIGDGKGNVLSEVAILDDATQTSRRIYYKNSAGTLRYIESD